MIPIALSLLVSTIFRTQVFYSRYLLFGQLFFLAGLGLLISSVRRPWVRHLAGGLLLVLMLGVDFRFIDKMDLEHHTSFRGAAAYIESQRRPGEPVVVCSQLFYLPLHIMLPLPPTGINSAMNPSLADSTPGPPWALTT